MIAGFNFASPTTSPRKTMPFVASNRLGVLVPLCLFQLGLAGLLTLPTGSAAEKGDDPKEALQELQDFIGTWKGTADKKGQFWKETSNWSWRFKGKEVWMTVETPDSKAFKSGELRFLSNK